MRALVVLAGGSIVAQASRIQPEVARLAPQVDAVSLGYQQVPAITLAAMRTVREEGLADSWGLRDPPRPFSSRASMESFDNAFDDLGPHSVADMFGQGADLQGLGTILQADAGDEVEAELSLLKEELAEAKATISEFDASEVKSAGPLRSLRKELANFKAEVLKVEARAKTRSEAKEAKRIESLEKDLEIDLEKREQEVKKPHDKALAPADSKSVESQKDGQVTMKMVEQAKSGADTVKVEADAQKDASTRERAAAGKTIADKGARAVVENIETQPGLEKVESSKRAASPHQKGDSTTKKAVASKIVADKGVPAVVQNIETQPGLEKVESSKRAASPPQKGDSTTKKAVASKIVADKGVPAVVQNIETQPGLEKVEAKKGADAPSQKGPSTKENTVAAKPIADKGVPAVVESTEIKPGLDKVEGETDTDTRAQKDASTREQTVPAKVVAGKGVSAEGGKTKSQSGSAKVEPGKDAAGKSKVGAQAQKGVSGGLVAVEKTVEKADAKVVAQTETDAGPEEAKEQPAEARDAKKAKVPAAKAELEKAQQTSDASTQQQAEAETNMVPDGKARGRPMKEPGTQEDVSKSASKVQDAKEAEAVGTQASKERQATLAS